MSFVHRIELQNFLNAPRRLGVNERMGLKLFGREIIFEVFQPMWSRYLIVTDGRTDAETDGQTDDIQSYNRALRSIAR